MKKLLIALMKCIDLIYPKKNNRIIVGSSNGRGIVGSPKILGEYLENKGYEVFYNWNTPPSGSKNICHNNFKDWHIFFSAKTCITSHSISDLGKFQRILTNNRTFIELWHGIPLKSMGQLMHNTKESTRRIERRKLKRVKLWSVTSQLFKQLYRAMYPLDENVFQVLGSPRNDQYQDQVVDFTKIFPDLPQYNKVILYAPTWREKESQSTFFSFSKNEIERIKKYIEENKIIIFLRGHINEFDKLHFTSPYIKHLGNDIIFDIDTVLSGFDAIITDYSSIYFDFLFFNRPIAFLPYDLEEYTNNRGLLFEYDSITPGDKISNASEMMNFFDNLLKDIDHWEEKRQWVFDLSNKHKDFNSCERIFNYLVNNNLLSKSN